MEMYSFDSEAVRRMADLFEAADPASIGTLTPAQMRTIGFAIRSLHHSPDWVAGFAACAHLMAGNYPAYAAERDRFLSRQ